MRIPKKRANSGMALLLIISHSFVKENLRIKAIAQKSRKHAGYPKAEGVCPECH